jgi:hypothetical protein
VAHTGEERKGTRLKERDHSEDRGKDAGWHQNGSWGDWLRGWIQVAWDRCQWQAVVNAVMNLQVIAPHS